MAGADDNNSSLRLIGEDENSGAPDHKKFLHYVVAVEWLDTVVSNSWEVERDAMASRAETVLSLGCLLYVDKERVVLSAGVSEGEASRQHNPTIVIPRSMIRRCWAPGRWTERAFKGRA